MIPSSVTFVQILLDCYLYSLDFMMSLNSSISYHYVKMAEIVQNLSNNNLDTFRDTKKVTTIIEIFFADVKTCFNTKYLLSVTFLDHFLPQG